MTLVLEVQQLKKRFVLHHRDGASLSVIAGLSLQVHRGECIALHGQSGRGKSTLLRCLYGNYRVDAGRVLLHQQNNVTDLARATPRTMIELRRSRIGYVSQFLRALPRVAAIDVVAEPLVAKCHDLARLSEEQHAQAWQQARTEAAVLMERLKLPSSLWPLPPSTFSGGEQQRINVARGLIKQPGLLLLDEPTASLDESNRQRVVELIQEAKQAGVAIVGVFHDEHVRDAVADRLVEI